MSRQFCHPHIVVAASNFPCLASLDGIYRGYNDPDNSMLPVMCTAKQTGL